MTDNGHTIGENTANTPVEDENVIYKYDTPMMKDAGFVVLAGNLFDAAIMKTSVISDSFREQYLQRPGAENVMECRAIVFEGPEDYHARIHDSSLEIDANCALVIRGCGPVGYPGSAEVVNMQPPDALIKAGVRELPTIGDGRQSGTSGSPSILNAAPESAVGGGLAILATGDTIRVDLNKSTIDMLVPEAELLARRAALTLPELVNHTPWQEIYRAQVGPLDTGGVLELATKYQRVRQFSPRESH
jgi:dihydroxy-acid dehydratase